MQHARDSTTREAAGTRQTETAEEARVRELRASSILDQQLDRICRGFSAVVEYEFNEGTKQGLYDTLRTDPAKARGLLMVILKSERAVDLLLETLAERLRGSELVPESGEILRLISGATRDARG